MVGKTFFKKKNIILVFLIASCICLIFYIYGLGNHSVGSSRRTDNEQAKNIETAINTLITDTRNSKLEEFNNIDGKKALPQNPSTSDLINMLKSKIYYNNKAYGPYLNPQINYSIVWNKKNGGLFDGFYVRIIKDNYKVFVMPVSNGKDNLANRVDIVNSTEDIALTPMPTPL